MAKYGFELKLQVVQDYQNGKGGYVHLAKKYGVASPEMIRRWNLIYEKFGADGLLRSQKNKNYSFDFKMHVVKLYLATKVSCQELAFSVGLKDQSLVNKWISDFRKAGPDALKPKKKGSENALDSSKKAKVKGVSEASSVDTSAEHVKQLEKELLKLKIENAYLKELRRLRLEEEALLKKRRESFTASEETSN